MAPKKKRDIEYRSIFQRIKQRGRGRKHRTFLRLRQAVRQCNGDLVKRMLQQDRVGRVNPSVNITTRLKGNFPILLKINARYGNRDITRSLIRAGYRRRNGLITVHDLNAALHIAVIYRHFDIADELIKSGAKVHAKNDEGKSLLEAVIVNTTQISHLVTTLIADFMPNIILLPLALRSILYVCTAQTNSLQTTRIYLKGEKADVSLSLVKTLLDAGAEVNNKEPTNGSTPILLAACTNNLKLVEMLINAGADINSQNALGITALHHAVLANDDAMVLLLLKRGANVALKTQQGNTALHWAAVYQIVSRHGMIIKHLLEFGSNVNEKNAEGQTILDFLIQREEVARCNMVIEFVTEVEATTNKRLFDEYSLAVINGKPEMKSHYDNCQAELTAMKDAKVGDTLITYLSVLTKPVEVVARYARNEDFINEFNKPSDEETAYPIHRTRLQARVMNGMIRQMLIEKASLILSETLQFADPSHVAFEHIAQYLTTADLASVIKSRAKKS